MFFKFLKNFLVNLYCLLRIVCVLLLVLTLSLVSQQKKKITPELAFKIPPLKLTKSLPNIIGWEDDRHYLESKKKEGEEKEKTYIVDAETGREVGEKKPIVNLDEYKSLGGDSIDIRKPIIIHEKTNRYIFIGNNDLYLLDAKEGQFKRLTSNLSEEKNPTFSPDGKYIAYTRDNNLFVIDLTSGLEKQITNDGSELVYNGKAAWLYYEEILGRSSNYKAFWWSPNGKMLAFFRFDETNVPMFPLFDVKGQHGTLEKTRYPKAGDPNPAIRIGIVNVEANKIVWADFNEKDDQYFGTPFWMPDSKELFVQWMNRGQDNLKIYSINPLTGNKKEIYDETQKSWVEWLEDIRFLTNKFIVKTDKDGWTHFYLHNRDGNLINRITQGKWAVVDIIYVDEDNNKLYFLAKKESTTRTDFYSIKLNGKDLKRLSFGNFTHEVKISPRGTYFITTYSNVSTPPRMALLNNKGKLIRELGDSRTVELDEYELAKTELIEITTSDGYKLPALLTMPTQFEQSKRYPVLISVYGGPLSPSVEDVWRFSASTHALASEGMIQVVIDHRGAGHYGKEGASLMHRNLGKWELNDYIEVVKWLKLKPYIDTNKICIIGGSYGGYIVALALTYGANYFTHGIASYSVIDWLLYDSHYTERYMDSPLENPEGYKLSSVLNYVNNYKGILRIVHGTMDDNVHMQNSLLLIDTLQNLNKYFEFMLYPGGRHGWGPPKSTHLRLDNWRFYYRYLFEKEFPKELATIVNNLQ